MPFTFPSLSQLLTQLQREGGEPQSLQVYGQLHAVVLVTQIVRCCLPEKGYIVNSATVGANLGRSSVGYSAKIT